MRGKPLFRRRHPVAVSLISVLAFLAFGGHQSRPFEPLERVLDRAVAATGLTISRVEIAGLRHANATQIHGLVEATGAKTLLGFRPSSLRRTIVATRPWVADAEVIRAWPDRLQIVIHERTPFAVLHERRDGQQQAVLVDRHGVRLEVVPTEAAPPLPKVFGVGAELAAHQIVTKAEAFPDIAADVLGYELVARRRWRLHLRGARVIELPANRVSSALAGLNPVIERLDVSLARTIDLRRPGTISLRMAPGPRTQARLKTAMPPDRRS